uniref:Ovule protein n=1 Tax=Heligmosomoides polygyrus TaxID=6339 RepID=A0A183FCH5_HELPZ
LSYQNGGKTKSQRPYLRLSTRMLIRQKVRSDRNKKRR